MVLACIESRYNISVWIQLSTQMVGDTILADIHRVSQKDTSIFKYILGQPFLTIFDVHCTLYFITKVLGHLALNSEDTLCWNLTLYAIISLASGKHKHQRKLRILYTHSAHITPPPSP